MPKRGVIASILTTVGLVVLISFKTPSQVVTRVAGSQASVVGRPQPGAANAPASPAPAAATPTPSSAANGTFTGPVITTQYGDVQVQASFSNGKLTDVVALTLPSDRARSAEISQQAAPILRQEALQAQSANIDLLSGATYTSEAYAQSLQAIFASIHA